MIVRDAVRLRNGRNSFTRPLRRQRVSLAVGGVFKR